MYLFRPPHVKILVFKKHLIFDVLPTKKCCFFHLVLVDETVKQITWLSNPRIPFSTKLKLHKSKRKCQSIHAENVGEFALRDKICSVNMSCLRLIYLTDLFESGTNSSIKVKFHMSQKKEKSDLTGCKSKLLSFYKSQTKTTTKTIQTYQCVSRQNLQQ